MPEVDYLDPEFAAMLQQPADDDTALMRAIRNRDREGVTALLKSGEIYPDASNSFQETALYLALRTGQLEVAETLHNLGAPDAENIVTDPRVGGNAPQHSLCLQDAPMTDEEVDQLFAAGHFVRTLKFENLARLRWRISEYIDRNYPRSRWRKPLAQSEMASAARWVSSLKKNGVARLGSILPANAPPTTWGSPNVADIRDYLLSRPSYNGHVHSVSDGQPRALAEVALQGGYGCYGPADAITAPHLWGIANSPLVLHVVSEYLGCMPTIYGSNVLWSFPRTGPRVTFDSQSAHRDFDYFGFITLFIYLTDVDTSAGPHRYYMGTHDMGRLCEILEKRFSPGMSALIGRDLYRTMLDGYGRLGMLEDLLADQICDVTGAAGTAFLADTSGFHRALPPSARPRLMAWFRYGAIPVRREQFNLEGNSDYPGYDAYVNRVLFKTLEQDVRERP